MVDRTSTSGRQRTAAVAVAAAVIGALLVLAPGAVGARPTAPSQAGPSSSCSFATDLTTGAPAVTPEQRCQQNFTLPPWSDAAGWDVASAYDTIQLADVNANGAPDLVAKGAHGIEVAELSADRGSCADTAVYSSSWQGCGTWVPLVGSASGSALQDQPRAWTADASYTDGNGQPVQVGDLVDSDGDLLPAVLPPTPVAADSVLLLTGDLDGDDHDEILAGNGTNVVVVSVVPPPGNDLLGSLSVSPNIGPAIDAGGTFDGSDWSQPQYAETIRLADFDGDGADELIARSQNGFWMWDYSAAQGFSAPHSLLSLTDRAGYDQEEYYDPILTGDVVGGDGADLLVRGGDGLKAWSYSDSGWAPQPVLSSLSDAVGLDGAEWYKSQYRQTIQLADIDRDGKDEVLARGTTNLWSIDFAGGAWQPPVPGPLLADVAGWADPARYQTIRPIELDVGTGGTPELRSGVVASTTTHLEAWTFEPGGVPAWTKRPHALALPTLTADWTQPWYYGSLRTTPPANDAALDVVVLRDAVGIRSFDYDEDTGWAATNAPFPVFTGDALTAYKELGQAYGAPNDDLRSTYDTNSDLDSTEVCGWTTSLPGGVSVDPATATAVAAQLCQEMTAAETMHTVATDASTVLSQTYGVSEGFLASAITALDAERSQSTAFPIGKVLQGAVDVLLLAVPDGSAIATVVDSVAGSTAAGVQWSNAKSQQTTLEAYDGTLADLETELTTRFQQLEGMTQDTRAAIVFDYGLLMTMKGLERGPWGYQSTDIQYAVAGLSGWFEQAGWAAAARTSGVDWQVYVCAPRYPGWGYPDGVDSSRTHCNTDEEYRYGSEVTLADSSGPLITNWIINHLGTGSIPPISQPSQKKLEKLYDVPSTACQTVWTQGTGTSSCPFGVDMADVYRGEAPWTLTCRTYYAKSAATHSDTHRYDPPCDVYQLPSDAAVATFIDVPTSHQFFWDVEGLVARGITQGYPDGTYRPAAPITRQAMAAFLYRMAGSPDVSGTPTGFPDVPADHPFRDAIAWMASTGLTDGYPDGTFRPSAVLSRQAAAAYLHRLAGAPDPAGEPAIDFPDVPDDHAFHDEIWWLVGAGLAGGYDDGLFRPTWPLSRQALAHFVNRYLDAGWYVPPPIP